MKSVLIALSLFLSIQAAPLPQLGSQPTPQVVDVDEPITLLEVPGLIINSTCPSVQTVNFTAVDARPWPLVAGQIANFYINGTSTETIYPGSALSVVVGLVTGANSVQTVYNQTFDGCDLLLSGLGLQCPVSPGDFYIPLSFAIPAVPLPSVNLVLDINAINGDESPIGCLSAELSLGELPIVPASSSSQPTSNTNSNALNLDLSTLLG